MGALEIWNKSDRMNLSNVIFLAIQSSTYFKELYRFKTYHEVVQEVRTEVMSIDPWIKGTRTPSTCMCLLFKLFTLRLTVKQLKNMLDKDPSQTVRAMAVLYLRLCCKPQSMWEWFKPLIEDDSELTLVPDKPAVPFGLFVIRMIKEQRFFDVLLPRIPVPIHRKMLDSEELKAAERFHIQAFNSKVGGGGSSRGGGDGRGTGRGDRDTRVNARRDDRRDDRRDSRNDDGGRRRDRRDYSRDDRSWDRGRRDDGFRDRGSGGYGHSRDHGGRDRDRGHERRRYDDRRERRSRERYGRDDDRYGGRKRYRSSSRSRSPSKKRRTADSPSPPKKTAPAPSAEQAPSASSASATFKKLQLLYGSGSASAPSSQQAKPSTPLTAREQQERLLKEAAALDLKHTGEDVVRLGY